MKISGAKLFAENAFDNKLHLTFDNYWTNLKIILEENKERATSNRRSYQYI